MKKKILRIFNNNREKGIWGDLPHNKKIYFWKVRKTSNVTNLIHSLNLKFKIY